MKRSLAGGAVLGALLLAGLATPAFAVPCPTGTMAGYTVSGFSCTVGDKVFADFSYTQVTGNAPAAADVHIKPILPGSGGFKLNEEGLDFSLAATVVGPGSLLDASWSFDVGTTSGIATITDAILQITGSVKGASSVATVGETIAFPTSPPTSTLLQTTITSTSSTTTDSATFGPFSTISPTKDLSVLVGPRGGSSDFASISDVKQVFSQTAMPEPASLVILGMGLIGLGMARRFTKSA